jgi:hypothetical protein
MKFFSKQEQELKAYIENDNLNPKNEQDLIKIVEYLATII